MANKKKQKTILKLYLFLQGIFTYSRQAFKVSNVCDNLIFFNLKKTPMYRGVRKI